MMTMTMIMVIMIQHFLFDFSLIFDAFQVPDILSDMVLHF